MSEARMVEVPNYDELSVQQLWPKIVGNKEFMPYFPDSLPKGRLPCRNYFFTIFNLLVSSM